MTQPKTRYFAVHRFNEGYAFSGYGRPSLTDWRDLLGILFIPVAIGMTYYIYSTALQGPFYYPTPNDWIYVASILVMILVILWVIFDFGRKWWLATTGKILDGKIIDARIEFKGGRGAHYRLYVSYTFVSPSGVTVMGMTNAMRNDLFRAPMPSAGTPIKVLYKNDHYHKAV